MRLSAQIASHSFAQPRLLCDGKFAPKKWPLKRVMSATTEAVIALTVGTAHRARYN